MKIVKRIGVFETNSSSTHTLALVSKQDYEADKSTAKPKYRKYNALTTKYDKLLMACGCCKELFDDNYNYSDDSTRTLACEATISLFVRVYCNVTHEDYDKTFAQIMSTNRSGRACHMKFFYEGALYEADYDYMLFDDMVEGSLSTVLDRISRYFDDETLLLYREFYNGVGMYDDDDDE